MSTDTPFQGSLFAHDFLQESVTRLDDWRDLAADAIDSLDASLRDVFARFPVTGSPNESQTEDDLIWPVLAHLGWTESLRQQNLSAHGRQDAGRVNVFETTWFSIYCSDSTPSTPRHRRVESTIDRAVVAAGQRPHAASCPGCRSRVLGHPGGSFSTAD